MGERPLARQAKCSQDPDLVYLGGARVPDRPATRPGLDPWDEGLAHCRCKELAVSQTGGRPACRGIDDDQSNRDWPSERAAAHLVASGDDDTARGEQLALDFEVRSASRGHAGSLSDPAEALTRMTVAPGARPAWTSRC